MNKQRYRCIASICISILMLCQHITLPIFATEQADWKRVDGTPLISFLDEEGNPVAKELEYIDASDSALTFNESKVSYGSIKEMDYDTVSLYFECIDYNFYMKENAEEILQNLQGTARLDFWDRSISEDAIGFALDERSGCLKVEVEFSEIMPFENENDYVNLFVQYQTDNGEETVTHKGEMKYTFSQRSETQLAEEKKPLSVELILPKEEDDTEIRSKTPYILLENCSIDGGADSVAAGSSFVLHFDMKNTHQRLDIENVLMQVALPDDLCLDNPGNSFYIGTIEKNGMSGCDLNLAVLPTASENNQSITLELTYEYVDEDVRRYETEEITLTISVYQPLKLVIDPIQVLPEYTVKQEYDIYSPYVNHSHDTMYHVTATMESDVYAQEKVIHLGNLAAGEGGSVHFVLQPQEIGTYPIEVTYTYENEWGQVYSESMELKIVCVEEQVEDEPITNPQPYIVTLPQSESTANDNPYVILLSIAGATLLALLLILWNNFRKE